MIYFDERFTAKTLFVNLYKQFGFIESHSVNDDTENTLILRDSRNQETLYNNLSRKEHCVALKSHCTKWNIIQKTYIKPPGWVCHKFDWTLCRHLRKIKPNSTNFYWIFVNFSTICIGEHNLWIKVFKQVSIRKKQIKHY